MGVPREGGGPVGVVPGVLLLGLPQRVGLAAMGGHHLAHLPVLELGIHRWSTPGALAPLLKIHKLVPQLPCLWTQKAW